MTQTRIDIERPFLCKFISAFLRTHSLRVCLDDG